MSSGMSRARASHRRGPALWEGSSGRPGPDHRRTGRTATRRRHATGARAQRAGDSRAGSGRPSRGTAGRRCRECCGRWPEAWREAEVTSEPSVWWWLATRTNLHRSNENVKNIGEERRTGGGSDACGPSGLAGPHARARTGEDAWQEDPFHPLALGDRRTARTEDRGETRARTRPSAQQSEPTSQHDRQHGHAADRPDGQPGASQRNPTRDQRRPRSGCVYHSTPARLGGGDRATHPRGEIHGAMRGRAHVPVPALELVP
jgi:hypothetical protein